MSLIFFARRPVATKAYDIAIWYSENAGNYYELTIEQVTKVWYGSKYYRIYQKEFFLRETAIQAAENFLTIPIEQSTIFNENTTTSNS